MLSGCTIITLILSLTKLNISAPAGVLTSTVDTPFLISQSGTSAAAFLQSPIVMSETLLNDVYLQL